MTIFERLCCWLGADVVWEIDAKPDAECPWFPISRGHRTRVNAHAYCSELREALPDFAAFEVRRRIIWTRKDQEDPT